MLKFPAPNVRLLWIGRVDVLTVWRPTVEREINLRHYSRLDVELEFHKQFIAAARADEVTVTWPTLERDVETHAVLMVVVDHELYSE